MQNGRSMNRLCTNIGMMATSDTRLTTRKVWIYNFCSGALFLFLLDPKNNKKGCLRVPSKNIPLVSTSAGAFGVGNIHLHAWLHNTTSLQLRFWIWPMGRRWRIRTVNLWCFSRSYFLNAIRFIEICYTYLPCRTAATIFKWCWGVYKFDFRNVASARRCSFLCVVYIKR